MNFDYAVHSDFLIHWTGKDIDRLYDPTWYESDKSKTNNHNVADLYVNRLFTILRYGLWMTEEQETIFNFGRDKVSIPATPKVCFTELKLSESRKHAKRYGRLGIGVKRSFVFERLGRPLVYFHEKKKNDKFLQACAKELNNADLLNFFKPMNSSNILNYDLYSESEWRIIYFKELLESKLIIDPRNPENVEEHNYFMSLNTKEQNKLKYLIPLGGWFAMIIYPSLEVKNKAQQDNSNGIKEQITRIKSLDDHGNRVEGRNWPIEVDLDACRNF
ncbi:MAG: hypothetical protein FJ134_10910 [Deltaproteobacteria bacterium]|nr:hypothetical protein [Deltaproteobacteria bacterium]